MERFKSCPRCQGNIFIDWDYVDGGWYETCLQCSFRSYLPALTTRAQEATVRVGKGKRGKSGRKQRSRTAHVMEEARSIAS